MSCDDFEGRGAGTAGGHKTVACLEQQFRAAGLAPGIGDSYLQAALLTGTAMTCYGGWTCKFEEAVRQGAAKPQFDLRTADPMAGRLALEGRLTGEAARSLRRAVPDWEPESEFRAIRDRSRASAGAR